MYLNTFWTLESSPFCRQQLDSKTYRVCMTCFASTIKLLTVQTKDLIIHLGAVSPHLACSTTVFCEIIFSWIQTTFLILWYDFVSNKMVAGYCAWGTITSLNTKMILWIWDHINSPWKLFWGGHSVQWNTTQHHGEQTYQLTFYGSFTTGKIRNTSLFVSTLLQAWWWQAWWWINI